jgi:hypothetical protein
MTLQTPSIPKGLPETEGMERMLRAWQSLGESGQVKASESENEILAVLDDLDKARAHSIAKAGMNCSPPRRSDS